jgi:aminopeptidase YwaD
MRKHIVILAIAALLVTLVQIPVLATSSKVTTGHTGSPFDKKITERFDSERSMEHISYLSEVIGPRVAGTNQEKEAANYIEQELERYGYEVSKQEFDIANRLEGQLTTSTAESEFAIRIATGSASTSEEGIYGYVYYSGKGEPGGFPDEVEGNIALIERGDISFWDKVNNATEAGASGVIIYDNADSLVPPTPSLGDNAASIPVVAITKADGESLLEKIESEEVTATIKISEITDQTSQNIIAVKEPKGKPTNDHDIVYVTAHYDSVPYGPGANDNASGTSVVLELARILKSYPTDKEVRFVFVGAEEIGLVGSRYYVSQLSNDELNRSLANFNLDMVGTNWEEATALFVNVVDGAPNLVWQSARDAAERLGNDSLILFERGASDHVAFYEAGIDAANFIRRAPVTASLEPWYHTPFDTIDKVSQERIQEAGELIGSAIYDFVRKETPRGKRNQDVRMNMGDYLLNEGVFVE